LILTKSRVFDVRNRHMAAPMSQLLDSERLQHVLAGLDERFAYQRPSNVSLRVPFAGEFIGIDAEFVQLERDVVEIRSLYYLFIYLFIYIKYLIN